MYKNQILQFKTNDLYEDIRQLYMSMNHLNRDETTLRKMKGRFMSSFEYYYEGIHPRAVISYYDITETCFTNGGISVDGETLKCPAFDRIDRQDIKGMYVYFVSAGGLPFRDNDTVANQLIMDTMGTATVNILRKRIQNLLAKNGKISEEFGPGLYGMDVTEMGKLNRLAEASKIGITVRENGLLLPMKSCGIIRFCVGEEYRTGNQSCKDCTGAKTGCELCMMGRYRS